MFQLKFLILLKVLICYFLTIVRSECFVDYPINIETVPRYEKHFGKYKLQLPYNGDKLRLEDKDVISGVCDTEFSSFYVNLIEYDRRNTHLGYIIRTEQTGKDLTTLELSCKESKLYYDDKELDSSSLACAKRQWSIYETNDSNLWCKKNQNSTTFIMGTKSKDNLHILAGICYNLEQLSLQTVNYNVTYSQRNPMEMLMNMRKTEIDLVDLDGFRTTKTSDLSDELLQQKLTEMSETNSWLHLANFEMAAIVQGDSYINYFNEYDNILNIIWWHNLRLGNWKRFMNTLENYAYNNSFELFTGTSDVVRFPADQKCEKNNLRVLEISVGIKNETIPGYIWTYLKSHDDKNQDFIIVGYNSPYAEFLSLDNVIFCPDICSEISWLSEIQSSFRYASAGIMFCCSTDFIRQSNHLNGFPMDMILTPLDSKTTTEEATDINVTPAVEENTVHYQN